MVKGVYDQGIKGVRSEWHCRAFSVWLGRTLHGGLRRRGLFSVLRYLIALKCRIGIMFFAFLGQLAKRNQGGLYYDYVSQVIDPDQGWI